MRIILYIIVLTIIILCLIGIHYLSYRPEIPITVETFQADSPQNMGATEAEIMIQCTGQFMLFIDKKPVLSNFISQPEKIFSQNVYLFSTSTIELCVKNIDHTTAFIGAIRVGQHIYPFHPGKGQGSVKCLGGMAKPRDFQESSQLDNKEFSGGYYEGCFALPSGISEINYSQGTYKDYNIKPLTGADSRGTIAAAHQIALTEGKSHYGVFTTSDNKNWVMYGNQPIGNLSSHQDHQKCVSSCSNNPKEKCGGLISSKGQNLFYAQCYSTNQPPQMKSITDENLEGMIGETMPSGPKWLWIREGPPYHQSQNWWLFSIYNPTSTTNLVCIYPQYSEFLPTACRDPRSAQQCKDTLRPGYIADDDSCISHYKRPEHFDTIAWRLTMDRAFHNYRYSKKDVFDYQEDIKIVFEDYFDIIYKLNIAILREDNQNLIADVLSKKKQTTSLSERCQRVQPHEREAVSYIDAGLNLCSAAGSPECDMLRTQCINDGYCFDDLHPKAPKCFKPAIPDDSDIINDMKLPNFNKSLTLASRIVEKPHLKHSPSVIQWKDKIDKFVTVVRLLEFMDDIDGCKCLAAEENDCRPC